MKTIRLICALCLASLATTGAIATDTDEDKEKKTPLVSINVSPKLTEGVLKDFKLHINGYAQGGYDYNSSDNSNSFNFKRAIVWAKADITPRWSFLYMHDFKNSTLEYYTAYSFGKGLNVRMGQFKTPLSMENPMSPSKLELIDCYSQPVRYLVGFSDPLMGSQGGRDLGLLFYGEAGNSGLKYEFGIMNGQGINKSDGNPEKDFVLKLDYRVASPLRIVVSGQLGRGHAIATSAACPTINEGDNYKRHRLTAGVEYSSDFLTLRSEWLKGWNGPDQSQGVYATMLKPLCKNFDAIASFDWLDKNTRLDMRQTNYTIGLQYRFFNKCRIQAQYTRCCPGFAKDYNVVQVQTQVGF